MQSKRMAKPLRYAILFSAQILILLSVCFLFQSLNITDQLRQILRRRKQHPGIHLKARLMDQLSLSRSDFDITARYLFFIKRKIITAQRTFFLHCQETQFLRFLPSKFCHTPVIIYGGGARESIPLPPQRRKQGLSVPQFPEAFSHTASCHPDPLSLRYPPAVPFPESHSRYFPPESS